MILSNCPGNSSAHGNALTQDFRKGLERFLFSVFWGCFAFELITSAHGLVNHLNLLDTCSLRMFKTSDLVFLGERNFYLIFFLVTVQKLHFQMGTNSLWDSRNYLTLKEQPLWKTISVYSSKLSPTTLYSSYLWSTILIASSKPCDYLLPTEMHDRPVEKLARCHSSREIFAIFAQFTWWALP